ncbi:MAG: heavy metal-binding domain-containing protein [Solobacterium sp.]|nr:heavy metal-binding domain-containing protein [Solobacterium sp.]MBQ9825313.1 heavy metal-binding domain-containing protein [Solobacterium sp.]
MILTTTETFPGRTYEVLGIVKGSTVQTVNAVRDIGASLKTLVGGEVIKYNELMNTARALATKRMCEEAEEMGADAVICVRYSSASIMQGAAEVMAYGTAIVFTA